MKLIVGLGNPGEKYAANRHNIGFMVVDEIAAGYRFPPWKKRFQGFAAEGQVGTEKCILLKPSTYMNDSGRSVGDAARFYKIAAGDVIVVHDELDLKPGVIRVKTGGGNAGHNGLKSISAHLGNEYLRVRLGIGHPGDKALVANYVLQDFAKSDQEWLRRVIDGVAVGMARLVEGSEAVFLSDAVRPRGVTGMAAPEKMNGSSAVLPDIISRSAGSSALTDSASIAAITAAASRPVQPMEIKPLTVAAVREHGGGAVSKPVVTPEMEAKAESDAARVPEPVSVATPSAEVVPHAPSTNGVAMNSPATAGETQITLPEQPYDAIHSPSVAIQDGANESKREEPEIASRDDLSAGNPDHPASSDKGLGSKLKSWFHSRARGKPLT